MKVFCFFRIVLIMVGVTLFGFANEVQIRSHSMIDRTLDDPVVVQLPHKAPSQKVVIPAKKATVANVKKTNTPKKILKTVQAPKKSLTPPKKTVTPVVKKQTPHNVVKNVQQKAPSSSVVNAPVTPVVKAPVTTASASAEMDISKQINQALQNGENGVEFNQSQSSQDENKELTEQSVENNETILNESEGHAEANTSQEESSDGISHGWIYVAGVVILVLGGVFLVMLVRQRKLSQKMEDLSKLSDHLQQSVDASHVYTKETKDLFKKFDQEIRKPLVVIRDSIDQLGQTKLNKQQNEALTNLYTSADCLVSMIDQAIDFSNIHHGDVHITQEPFLLSALFDALRLTHEERALRQGLSLTFSQGSDVPNELIGDFATMEHILDELIGNALAFTDEGEVSVTANVVKEGTNGVAVRFEVKDTGCGIDQDRLKRLMHAPQTSLLGSSQRPSLGVGLAICKALTHALGGAMTAQSDKGVGSIFIVVVTMDVVKKVDNVKPMVARVGKRVVPEERSSTPLDSAVIATLKDFISLFEFSPQKIEQLVTKKGYDELKNYLQSIRSICVATHSRGLLNSVIALVKWADEKGSPVEGKSAVQSYEKAFAALKKKVLKGG